MLAAAILARRGHRVALLERSSDVGGRLRSFDLDGFVIDAGAYLLAECAPRRRARCGGRARFRGSTIPSDQVMRVFVQGHGGRRSSRSPGRGEPPRRSCSPPRKPRSAPTSRSMPRSLALWDRIAALSDAEVDALEHVPLREVLSGWTSDDRVRRAFPEERDGVRHLRSRGASAAECIRLRRRRVGGVVPRPECAGDNPVGGVRALALALRSAVERAGVDLRLGCEVEQIAVDGGARARRLRPWSGPLARAHRRVRRGLQRARLAALRDDRSGELPADFVADARSWSVVGGVIALGLRLRCAAPSPRHERARPIPRLDASPDRPGARSSAAGCSGRRSTRRGTLLAVRACSRPCGSRRTPISRMRVAWRRSPKRSRARRRGSTSTRAQRLLWSRSWITRDGSEYMVSAARRARSGPRRGGLYLVGETTDVGAVQMDAAALSALRCADLVGSH